MGRVAELGSLDHTTLMFIVTFFGIRDGDTHRFELEQVPRVGDTVTLDNPRVYRVESVRWQLTALGLREATVVLQYIEDVR